MGTPMRRLLGHFEALFIDHAVFRLAYANRHRVSERMWRAAQPSPSHIRWAGENGIRTILNLRGERDCASYILEEEACRQNGVTLVNFPVSSRSAPRKEILRAAAEVFRSIEYPALMHCKSGADRAGFMAALYLLIHENRPLAEAQRQLSWKYGHFRQAKTGVLDYFFDVYGAAQARTGISFFDWVDRVYDPDEVQRNFVSRAWADTLVDGMLKRE